MGDTLVQRDHIDLDRVHAMAGLLDRADRPSPGDLLPLLWSFAFFLPRPAQSGIGPDGHPRAGFPTPPHPGLRRMFAGGRVTVAGGLHVGNDAVATTTVASSVDKQGRSGPMHIVTTRTEITVDERPVLVDERDIVYLDATPTTTLSAGRWEPVSSDESRLTEILDTSTAHRRVDVDPTLLFRFSALTYNAHRIHYDRDYARTVEGHPGLVVHGPLQALLMAELAQTDRPIDHGVFGYRLRQPLYEDQGMIVVATGDDEFVVVDDDGRTTATATLTSR